MNIRPRRSVLYMPGSNARALEKARSLPADAVVLDLEDSVGPEKKIEAREQVIAAVAAGGFGQRELVIRSNGLDTQWARDDIAAIAGAAVAAVCLPKIETADQVRLAAQWLDESGANATMAIWAMIETPKGVLNAAEIAAAHPRLSVLVMGTTDLAKELRVPHTPQRLGLLASLGQCVLAARAAGIDILDGVYLELDNGPGFQQSCHQGRELGFDGKTLIHPKQIEAANQVFAPSPEELERSRKIIAAWQQAKSEGKGVVVVDGKLVEGMHVDEARRQLAMAKLIEQLASG